MHIIRELRMRKGIRRAVLANAIGWSESSLRDCENGKRVGDSLICRLAESLGLTINDARSVANGQNVEGLGGAIDGLIDRTVRNVG